MSLFSQVSKIAFRKKPSLLNDGAARIIADEKGIIIEANKIFAAKVGLAPSDLIGRNLLDTILFQDLSAMMDDRAVFNNFSDDSVPSLSKLSSGLHGVFIGDNQLPMDFYFDWISDQNGKEYLVAGSVDDHEDIEQNWDKILQDIALKNNKPKRQSRPKSKPLKHPEPEAKKAIAPHEISDIYDDDAPIFEAITDNLKMVISQDGSILRANGAFSDLFQGVDNFFNIVDEGERAAIKQCLQSLNMHDAEDGMDNGAAYFDTQMVSNKRQDCWIQWCFNTHGSEIYALGTCITEKRKIELSLVKHEKDLFEAQALAKLGHWRWNAGSADIEWSDQIYQIFGVNAEEFNPTLDNANSLIHKRDIGHMMQAFQRAIIEQNNYDIDFRVVRADGSIRYVRCEGRCELDADGDVVALYGVMQDITAHTEHEMELRAAKDSAEQAYASKSRFLANMSHELRTPLNAIIGFSDMISSQMMGPLGNEKYLDYAQSIHESGQHLLSLIADILDMSKIEAGKYELDIEEVSLGEMVCAAAKMIEARAQEGKITIENNVEGVLPIISADRRAIMQILLNILSNAVKFTEQDGTISLSIDEFDNHITIRIADTGIGIPANKLSTVLRPFEQVSTAFTRNHEGSGLGLSITKELIELHDGSLSLDSVEGKGTCVSIKLPK